MDKTQTDPIETAIENWASVACGLQQDKGYGMKRGQPEEAWTSLVVMNDEWARIPNALFEDESEKLWLGFMAGKEMDEERGFWAVDVEQALAWLQNVSDLADGWNGDVADVARIALCEIRRLRQCQGTSA